MKALKSIGRKFPDDTQSLANGCFKRLAGLTYVSVDYAYEYGHQTLNFVRLTRSFESTGKSQEKLDYSEHVRSICQRRLELTSREIDCYLLYAQGSRSKEIAKELGISYRTVEKHIENIKDKLQCSTLASVINTISQYLYDELS